jgi:hypothetical protein
LMSREIWSAGSESLINSRYIGKRAGTHAAAAVIHNPISFQ